MKIVDKYSMKLDIEVAEHSNYIEYFLNFQFRLINNKYKTLEQHTPNKNKVNLILCKNEIKPMMMDTKITNDSR